MHQCKFPSLHMIEWLTYFVIISELYLTDKSKHSYKCGIKDYIGHNHQIIFSQHVSSQGLRETMLSLFLISPQNLCIKMSFP